MVAEHRGQFGTPFEERGSQGAGAGAFDDFQGHHKCLFRACARRRPVASESRAGQHTLRNHLIHSLQRATTERDRIIGGGGCCGTA